MKGRNTGIDITDVYNQELTQEIETYRHYVAVFINQIFYRHFIKTGLVEQKTHDELFDLDFHPSLTAYHFTRKMITYFLDRGVLSVNESGYLIQESLIVDDDPEDEKLNQFLDENPDKQNFYNILRNIRDVADQVLFKGEDALLTLANDNFRQAMKLWEDLMLTARVKQPCHQLVLRAMQQKAEINPSLTIFEGGAGIGSILRDGLNDPKFMQVMEKLDHYYFTDISLSLIKIGREALRNLLPETIYDRFQFKTANLDELFLNGSAFTHESSLDMIILEHVLYDVVDLDKTLQLFRRILKPGGYLVFTMAFRSAPKDFFLFEYLQSTFQSYNKAKLEPNYRENIGYLSLEEWENSLKRAGFEKFDVYPNAEHQVKWPYGGIIAIPSK